MHSEFAPGNVGMGENVLFLGRLDASVAERKTPETIDLGSWLMLFFNASGAHHPPNKYLIAIYWRKENYNLWLGTFKVKIYYRFTFSTLEYMYISR